MPVPGLSICNASLCCDVGCVEWLQWEQVVAGDVPDEPFGVHDHWLQGVFALDDVFLGYPSPDSYLGCPGCVYEYVDGVVGVGSFGEHFPVVVSATADVPFDAVAGHVVVEAPFDFRLVGGVLGSAAVVPGWEDEFREPGWDSVLDGALPKGFPVVVVAPFLLG